MSDTDAERREAIIRMFTPTDLNEQPAEPPVEGLAPKDKPLEDYTPEEREAQHQLTLQTVRMREERDERERQQLEADATRTPAEQHGDLVAQLIASKGPANAGKGAADAALLRAIHPENPE